MDPHERKQKVFEELCNLEEGKTPTAAKNRMTAAGFKSPVEMTEYFLEPGMIDEFWDYCVAANVAAAAPVIISELVAACLSGSPQHIKMLLQMLNKLRPEAEQHLHLQLGRQSDDELIRRLDNIKAQFERDKLEVSDA